MSHRINVGVVGCGDIAQKSYLPALTGELGRSARVAAVCDSVRERADTVRARFRVPRSFSDHRALLREGGVDAVVVLTPLLTHARFAGDAIRAGKHVYTEKPMAPTVRAANALVRAARARRVVLASAPSTSVTPVVLAVRRLLARGAIGKVCLARGHSSHGGPGGVWNTDYSWVYRRAVSGPVPPIFDMGIYGIATLASLLGPVRRVTALSGLGIRDRLIEVAGRKPYRLVPDSHDNSYLLMDFGDGRLGVLDASYCYRVPDGPPFELYGSDGTLQLYPWQSTYRVYSRRGADGIPRGRWVERTVPAGPGTRFVDGLRCFLEAIPGRREPFNGGAFSRHLVDIMESGIRAAQSGRARRLATSFAARDGAR